MAIVNTYLYFNGDCEEAFELYKSAFDKEFKYVGRYKDVSQTARHNFPNCEDEHIMHIALPISEETILMGADIIDNGRNEKNAYNNFSLYVSTDSKKEANRIFKSLSSGGEIKLPMSDQFWGSYYGICVDKFGVQWKISFAPDS